MSLALWGSSLAWERGGLWAVTGASWSAFLFVGGQAWEWARSPGSEVAELEGTGLHGAHVLAVAGVGLLLVGRGFGPEPVPANRWPILASSRRYWWLVDGV